MEDIKNLNTAMLEFKRNTLEEQIIEIEHSLSLTKSKLITMYNTNLLEKKREEMEAIDEEIEYRKKTGFNN